MVGPPLPKTYGNVQPCTLTLIDSSPRECYYELFCKILTAGSDVTADASGHSVRNEV